MSARIAHEQALFSSGDRSVGRVIEVLAENGGDLPAALRETGFDAAFHTGRARTYEEFLPWEIVDAGLGRAFMQREHERAQIAKSTAPCPSVSTCERCGVCPPRDPPRPHDRRSIPHGHRDPPSSHPPDAGVRVTP